MGSLGLLAGFAPFAAMPENPVGEGVFEADVVADFFRLQPFMTQDFLPLGLEFAVQRGVPYQVCTARSVDPIAGHRALVSRMSGQSNVTPGGFLATSIWQK